MLTIRNFGYLATDNHDLDRIERVADCFVIQTALNPFIRHRFPAL